METALADGTPVVIRPIRPSDKPALAAAHARLSDESVRRRFLTPKPRLTSGELRYLTEVDGRDHVALVAALDGSDDRIIAVARSVRLDDDPTAAEAAVVVGDDYQRQGLGRTLGLMLADAARARGIRRLTATTLGDNLAAHRLMRAVSRRLSDEPPAAGLRTPVGEIAA